MEKSGSLIMESLEDKSILITGSTGFLSKLFVEKVLRTQPNVRRLYLLVRAEDAVSAKHRLQTEVLEMDVFRILREKYGGSFDSWFWSKVYPIAGDVALEGLGVRNESVTTLLWGDVNIIINGAATTKFNERYDVALSINTLGSKNILAFATRCTKLEMLLHVSTAYVAKEKSGLIFEKALQRNQSTMSSSSLNIEDEVKLVEEKVKELKGNESSKHTVKIFMKELGMERANLFGWSNTYSFTKAMGEMLLVDQRGNLPLIIFRPTIITSTYKDPFPGWIEGVRTVDMLIIGYGTGKLRCFPANLSTILDMVPADMVVNAMLATISSHLRQPLMFIYNVGSSLRNPSTVKAVHNAAIQYFAKNPYTGRDGRPIKVGRFFCFSKMASFYIYTTICHKLPLLCLWMLCVLLWSQNLRNRYDHLDRMYNQLIALATAYKPYTLFQRSFDDSNTQKLRVMMNEKDQKSFEFDTKCINWEHYLTDVHIPGLLTYGMKKI